MKILAKNYATRSELESDVKSGKEKLGKNEIITIEGTVLELERLSLSPKRTVHGVSCIASDSIPQSNTPAPPRPHRGEIKQSSINGLGITFKKHNEEDGN